MVRKTLRIGLLTTGHNRKDTDGDKLEYLHDVILNFVGALRLKQIDYDQARVEDHTVKLTGA